MFKNLLIFNTSWEVVWKCGKKKNEGKKGAEKKLKVSFN